MAVYWLSFRIHDDAAKGKTYDERYGAFEESILAHSPTYWKETTSFIIFNSSADIDTIAANLKIIIDPAVDLFLLRKMNVKSARICGANHDPGIFNLITYLKQI